MRGCKQGNGTMALVVAVLLPKLTMSPAEKRVHIIMMEKQLDRRVSLTLSELSFWFIFCVGKCDKFWVFSWGLGFLAEKCSCKCVTRNLVDLQTYEIGEKGECVEGAGASEKVPLSYLRVSVEY